MTESNKATNSLPIHAVSTALPSQTSPHNPKTNDAFDRHNKPRLRRDILLSALSTTYPTTTTFHIPPSLTCDLLDLYSRIHDVNMIRFLSTAWSEWKTMGETRGHYEECCHPQWTKTEEEPLPPLIPCHAALRNCPNERPSTNVMGAMGYYCTDTLTPIVGSLVRELQEDATIVGHAVQWALREDTTVVYAVTTHPGHHANRDNFGGYCYLNNAALCARLMQWQLETGKCIVGEDGGIVSNYWGRDNDSSSNSSNKKKKKCRVAIIDVDYHCGNGTASIFYSDPSVFFTSIHCDPAIEYPFNQGYADQTGSEEGEGTTLHIPLAPGATWDGAYKEALEKAMKAIVEFDVAGLVVSLGLDTYEGDSVAVNRAGFKLSGNDYYEMGLLMGKCMMGKNIPTVFVQEGGYKMDVVGVAAAKVVGGYATGAAGGE
ncbi:hypothetical protein HJC23_004807 [Cyclotella cryptica]|uniref:Histone deacetylase domain-containing protein n=1 Tax=Cyclotella cryptica TaxID=29204 RepID=A0ABD3PXZ5_9STRA|eukprot:CCRYP_010448-RA/>CCRYP_010448-RA protein AED:0.28 eAED:0.28 QI:62/1/1/1/1/1/2/2098/429